MYLCAVYYQIILLKTHLILLLLIIINQLADFIRRILNLGISSFLNLGILQSKLDYYKAFFEDDHEVHAIINESLGITTRVACDNGMLFVTVFQYHQDDERKTIDIFYGKPTSEYVININTGDIEKKSNFLWWQTP